MQTDSTPEADQRTLFDEPAVAASSAPQVAEVPAADFLAHDRERWTADPVVAFTEWKESQSVNKRKYDDHSVGQYASMFGRYVSWLRAQGLRIEDAREEHLDLFLSTKRGRVSGDDGIAKPAAASTRRRYLQLLDKVYTHLRLLELTKENPAAPLLDLTRHQSFIKPAPRVLSMAQQEDYISTCNGLHQAQLQRAQLIQDRAHLADSTDPSLGWIESQLGLDLPQEQAAPPWVIKRDLALRLTFLASGITVQEMQRLGPSDVLVEGGESADTLDVSLQIAAHNFVPARRAPLAAFAADALIAWRQHLLGLSPAAKKLFPARKVGFNHDDLMSDRPISSSEAYLCIQPVLDHVAPGPRQGPQTLRNSFLLRQIYDEVPLDRIISWTGLASTESLHRIKMLVPIRRDGVRPT